MSSALSRFSHSRLVPSIPLALVLLASAGAASADTGSTTYNGCENVASGVVRLLPNHLPAPYNGCITAGNPILQSAPSLLEVPITWNQAGQQGLRGLPGPQGVAGPAGPQGPQGGVGATGAAGSPGTPGSGAVVQPVGAGDPNCPSGGAKITDGAGNTSFACNGAPGAKGDPGSSLSSVASLAGSACNAANGSAGAVSEVVSSTNVISLVCVPGATSAVACPHMDGLGDVYSDCSNPAGTPGVISTFNRTMAEEARAAFLHSDVCAINLCSYSAGATGCVNSHGTIDANSAIWVSVHLNSSTDFYAETWQFGALMAGYVHTSELNPADDVECAVAGDPTWN